jgi:hypothetical protein
MKVPIFLFAEISSVSVLKVMGMRALQIAPSFFWKYGNIHLRVEDRRK